MENDMLALKIQTDNNDNIWYLNSDNQPVPTNKPLTVFLMNKISKEMPHYRVIGTQRNVHLLLALYGRRAVHADEVEYESGMLEVCSPAVCSTKAELEDPVRALYAMRTVARTASVGGWHIFNKDDYASYAVASHLQKGNEVDDHALRLIKAHPVWAPITFIRHLNIHALTKLVATILDPRWYIDPSNPTRGSKLRAYLGLDLHTLLGVIGDGPKQRYHERCKLVLATVAGEHDLQHIERPDYFLWRIRRDKANSVTGVLRSLQTFIEFLRLSWLAMLGRGRHQNEALFVPEYFFNEHYEAEAYQQHMRRQFGVD